MLAVTRASGSTPAPSGRSTRSSPELDANLRTARAQMADWVTCVSAKTPEGKAKIEQISAKMDSIKQQIKKTETQAPADTDPTAASSAPSVDYRSAPERVGLNVDTYA